jgi:hypothetical protein
MVRVSRLVPFLFFLALGPLAAQDISDERPAGEQVTARISRTETPPTLDGVLDDAAWEQATVIDDFHQFNPVDHAPPSEKTIVYLAYDDDNLYVAARMYDSEPDQIRARQLVQGASSRWDDNFGIIIDPFNNKRTGYQFQTNPNGVRGDGTFETPTDLNRDWEGIWFNGTRIDEEGWVAELAIPFKTLNFDPSNSDWGFTVERSISRKQEEISWSSYNRRVNPGSAGLVTGFTGLRQGRGLDVIPSIVTSEARNFDTGVVTSEIEPVLDVFYNFTPSLTGVLTLNTDFSATEVDDRQVNLTRFNLFFPEKRDFFLRDVDIFSFGGLERNGLPFNSRRIGLDSRGQPVDLEVGAKLTGRVGRFNVGVLGVQEEAHADVTAKNLFVGRVAANVLRESSVGLILTDGDPNNNEDNSLVGLDFRYRNSNLPSGITLAGEAWYQATDTQGVDSEQDAWGVRIASPNTVGWEAEFGFQHIEENYNPALGFANRTGIEFLQTSVGHTRVTQGDGWLRSISHAFNFRNYDLISGGLQSRSVFLEPFELETTNGDEFGTQITYDREVLLEPFEISDGVVIPVGDYEFTRYGIEVAGANARVLAPSFEAGSGEFFTGDRLEIAAGLDWRPNDRLFLGVKYEYNDIKLPEGDFVTRLVQINANFAFNPQWSWLNLLQYDNESGSAGINSRLRWNPRAGQDLFIVLNHGFSAERTFRGLDSTQSQFSIKYTQTFRF